VTASVISGQLKITYPVVTGRTDVTIAAETSTTLDANSFSTTGVTTSDGATQGHKTMKEASIDATGTKGFIIVAPQ
jgi:hypothetical protein